MLALYFFPSVFDFATFVHGVKLTSRAGGRVSAGWLQMEMRAAQSSNTGMTGREHIIMAAFYDHIEGMELKQPTHLLQVPTVMHDAYLIQQTIEELEDSDYRENDLTRYIMLIHISCKILRSFLEYIKKGKSFLSGRAYCSVCGVVLPSRQDEQNSVDEQLLGALPNEPVPY